MNMVEQVQTMSTAASGFSLIGLSQNDVSMGSPHVAHQRCFFGKFLLTVAAGERPYLQVYRAQVSVEISPLGESFGTMLAKERLLLVVEPLVSDQVRVTDVAADGTEETRRQGISISNETIIQYLVIWFIRQFPD